MHKKYAEQNTARMEKILESSATVGLTSDEAQQRLRRDGKNKILLTPQKPWEASIGQALQNGSMPLFLLALLLTLPYTGATVLFPLLLYTLFLVSFFILSVLRYRAVMAHEKTLLPYVRVIRGGEELRISPEELVKGDLLLLSPGDMLYSYAHVVSEAPMKFFCRRKGKNELFLKYGGDCFDGTEEPFNSLRPGDIIREGEGLAFVTFLSDAPPKKPVPVSETLENHGKLCDMATRVSFFLSFFVLLVGFFRTCFAADATFLAECLLLSGALIATTSTAFYSVIFDLLFLAKNKKNKEQNGALFVSPADMETLIYADSFVLSSRSMFRSAQYVARYFETASGKRITDAKRSTAELSFITDALFATQKKCMLTMKEQAILGLCASHATVRELVLYGKASNGTITHASYQNRSEGKTVSVVWGEAEHLIPELVYVSEDGRTRILDAKSKKILLDGVRRLHEHGYLLLTFAETQVRNSPEGVATSFPDLKLLGFFALRKATDARAEKTLSALKQEGKKVFFVHDGENADWLKQEVDLLEDVPVLDGNRESFREELGIFAEDKDIPFCIGVNLTALQRAQIVQALEIMGNTVVSYGESFEDHRMMCAATAAIAPIKNSETVPPIVMNTASLLAEEHISSQIGSVCSAADLLSSFGVLTAALCAFLIGRSALVLIGILFGVVLLPVGYFILIGIVFDLLAFYCFAKTVAEKRYAGPENLLRQNAKNASLFVGFLAGALATGAIASYMLMNAQRFSFSPWGFVVLSLLLLMNVGMWRFSSARHSAAMLLFPVASLLLAALLCILGHLSGGSIGFSVQPEVFFWILFPVVALMAAGTLSEAYLKRKKEKIDVE